MKEIAVPKQAASCDIVAVAFWGGVTEQEADKIIAAVKGYSKTARFVGRFNPGPNHWLSIATASLRTVGYRIAIFGYGRDTTDGPIRLDYDGVRVAEHPPRPKLH